MPQTPPDTKVAVVTVGEATVGRLTLQPGWRWSEAIKPIVGTESCEVHHLAVLVSGNMHIVHSDGTEVDVGPGAKGVCLRRVTIAGGSPGGASSPPRSCSGSAPPG